MSVEGTLSAAAAQQLRGQRCAEAAGAPVIGPRIAMAVVSLAAATVRREMMRHQLQALNIGWTFFDAHRLPSAELILHPDKWLRINGRLLKPSELGCYSSHHALLAAHGRRDDDDVLVVLEDDALLDCEFFEQPSDVLRLVREFGYVRLNAQMAAPPEEVKILGRRRLVRFKKKVHGTVGYMVDARTARAFAKHLQNVYRPVDVEMDRFWDHRIPILCLYQFVAIERSAATQIGDRELASLPLLDHFCWKLLNQVEKLRCAFANLGFVIKRRLA